MFEAKNMDSKNVQLWLDSQDDMLIELANYCIGKPLPSETELIELLAFFNIFSIGYREMGEPKWANIYKRRADLFSAGLTQLGLSSEYRKEYVRNMEIPGPALRIKTIAASRAAYVMCDLKRYLEVPHGR